MKKALLLIFGALVALPALTQTPIKGIVEPSRPVVEGLTGQYWMQKIRIEVRDNTVYKWIIEQPNDSVRYFEPMDGKKYKATVVFEEITSEPIIDIAEVETGSFSFSPTNTAPTNSVNTTGWSQFDSDIAPNPTWCLKFNQGSCSFAETPNATITYTFIGKRIEVWGEKGKNKGLAGFKIDHITEQVKDLYTAEVSNDKELIFEADLPQGEHILTIRATGNKNASSTAAFVLVDFLKIYSER
jgi:hypothetical protein